MTEEKGNRVVVIDEDRTIKKIKTDGEIVKENEVLEKELKGKAKKQKLEEILAEKKELKKKAKKEKAEKAKKEEDMSIMLVDESNDRALNWGVIGVGQAGSKIAAEFAERGYSVVAINSALQDLQHINIQERYKLFLDYSLGGAAKDLDTGKAIIEEYRDEVKKHIKDNTEDCEVLILCIGGGGGTGSGSAESVISIMTELGKPLSVLYILPMGSEDSLAKHNAIQTLSRLAKLAKDDVVNSLIVVDNAKIELMFPDKSMAEFWKIANTSIVEPLHLFNTLSAGPSEYTSLDPMDFSRLFIGTGDCALYGSIGVENYLEDEAIAEAMVTNLKSGLLSDHFDLTQTRSAGIIICGSKEVLSKVPANNIEYGFSMVGKITNDGGTRIFRGVYEIPSGDDVLYIYSYFSGLGLPEERVDELKAEAKRHMDALKNKEDKRATSMNVDVGGPSNTTSAVDALHKKITNKHSAMGKLKKNSERKRVIDKRRR